MHIAGITRLIYNIVNIGTKFKRNVRFSGKFAILERIVLLMVISSACCFVAAMQAF